MNNYPHQSRNLDKHIGLERSKAKKTSKKQKVKQKKEKHLAVGFISKSFIHKRLNNT